MPLYDVEKIIRSDPLEDYYDVGNELGRGKFAIVKKCTEKSSGEQFAAKVLKKRRRGKSCREEILVEIDIMRQANEAREHPRIIRLHEVFESAHEFFIILELATGGELFRVIAIDPLPEDKAREVVHQIVDGVQHLHALNIVHLDLKPENILLYRKGQLDIKIADFGLSVQVKEGQEMKTLVGTAEYVSPEILNFEPLSIFTDMWSIGALTYALLTGYSPFQGETHQETFLNVSQCDFDFDDEVFDVVSQEAKDFIELLLVHVPRKRMSAQQCLEHPWMKARKANLNSSTTSLDSALCMDSPSSVEPSPASSTSSSFSPAPSSSTTSHSSSITTSTVTTSSAGSASSSSYSQPEDMHKVNEKLSNISTLATERHMAEPSSSTTPTPVPAKPREKALASPTGTDSSSSTIREDGSVESLSSLVNEVESSPVVKGVEKGRGEPGASSVPAPKNGGSSEKASPSSSAVAMDDGDLKAKKDEGKSVYSRAAERERFRKSEGIDTYFRTSIRDRDRTSASSSEVKDSSKYTPVRERVKSENVTDGSSSDVVEKTDSKPSLAASNSKTTSPASSLEEKDFKRSASPSKAFESKDYTKLSDRKYTSRLNQSDESKTQDTSSIREGRARDYKSSTLERHFTSSYTTSGSNSAGSTPTTTSHDTSSSVKDTPTSKDTPTTTSSSSRYNSNSEGRYKSATLGRRDIGGGVSRFSRDYDLLGTARSKVTDKTRSSVTDTKDSTKVEKTATSSPSGKSSSPKSSSLGSPKLKGKHHRPVTPEPNSPELTDVQLLRSPDRWGRRKSEGMRPIPVHAIRNAVADARKMSNPLVEEDHGDSSDGEEEGSDSTPMLRGSPVETEERHVLGEEPKKSQEEDKREKSASPPKFSPSGQPSNESEDAAERATPTSTEPAPTTPTRASSEAPSEPSTPNTKKEPRHTYSSDNVRRSANTTPTSRATPTAKDTPTRTAPFSFGLDYTNRAKRSESTRGSHVIPSSRDMKPRSPRSTRSSENVRAESSSTPSSSERPRSRHTSSSENLRGPSPTPSTPPVDGRSSRSRVRQNLSSENLRQSANTSPVSSQVTSSDSTTPDAATTTTSTAATKPSGSKPSSPTPSRSSKPPSPSPSTTKPPSPSLTTRSKPPSPTPAKITNSKYTSCTANLFTTNSSPFTAEESRPYTSVLRRTTDTSKRGETLPRTLSSLTRSPIDQAWRESTSSTQKFSAAPVRGRRATETDGDFPIRSKASEERPPSRGTSPKPPKSDEANTSGKTSPAPSSSPKQEEKEDKTLSPRRGGRSSRDPSPNRDKSPVRKTPPSVRRGYVRREERLEDKTEAKEEASQKEPQTPKKDAENKPNLSTEFESPEIRIRAPSTSEKRLTSTPKDLSTDVKLRKKSPMANHLMQTKQMRRQTPVISEDALAMILSGDIPDLDEEELENPLSKKSEDKKLETCIEEEEPAKKFSPVTSRTGSRTGSHTPILKYATGKSTSPDHATPTVEKKVSISTELSVSVLESSSDADQTSPRPRRKFLSTGMRSMTQSHFTPSSMGGREARDPTPPSNDDEFDPCSSSMNLRGDAAVPFSRLRSASLSHSRSTPDLSEIASKKSKSKRVERSNSKRLFARSRGDIYINTSTQQAGSTPSNNPTSPRRSGVITFSPKHSIASRLRASFSGNRKSDSELPEVRNRGSRTLK